MAQTDSKEWLSFAEFVTVILGIMGISFKWIGARTKEHADEIADRKAERETMLTTVAEKAGKAAARELFKEFESSHIAPMNERFVRIESEQKEQRELINDMLLKGKG